ncbi:hypothetical protein ACEWPM_002600 [Roseovarius sp. S4756]|uniref:hypothetical protein n=1 Tax=Roseovarius maritimus TaxID=3342637 RepID=UPI003727ABFD
MSAPDTNTEKTKPAHKTPISGMVGVVIFAVVLLLGLVVWLSFAGNDPGDEAGVDTGVNTQMTDGVAADGAAVEGTAVEGAATE